MLLSVETDFGDGRIFRVADGYTKLCAAVIGQALVDGDLTGLHWWAAFFDGDVRAIEFMTPRQRYAAGYALLKLVGSAGKCKNRRPRDDGL
jgi:hypothetical protein